MSPKDQVKPEEVVLTIGNEKITRSQFETIKAGLPPQYAAVPQQMGDKGFAGAYAQFRGLAIEGERQKLDQTREFREQLNFLRTELLARLAVSAFSAKSQEINDQEIKAYYDSHTAELQQAKVKGIFVALNPPAIPAAPAAGGAAAKAETPKARTDEEAKARAEELRKQILAGADFATVARENSDHQASAEKGGDLGTLRKGSLPPNLDKTVFALKPKEVSEPVKEGQGYYIFQVDEIRPVTLDEATASIRNTLQQQKMTTALERVKTDYPVVYNDKYFGEAPGQPGAPARPVITGVAPAQPGAAGVPAPAAKPAPAPPAPAPAPPPAKKPEKK
jgi:parvulin-like peptidyl-prolyl isomerase